MPNAASSDRMVHRRASTAITAPAAAERGVTAASNDQDITFAQKILNAYKNGSGVVKVSAELMEDSAWAPGVLPMVLWKAAI